MSHESVNSELDNSTENFAELLNQYSPAEKELKNNEIKEFEIDPQAYGIKRAGLESILGGNAKDNAKILYNIFDNNATNEQRDIVLINTATALMVDGMARDIQDGLEIAKEMLTSNKAKEQLKNIIEISNKL